MGKGHGKIKANSLHTPKSLLTHTISDDDRAGLEDLSAEDWNRLKSIVNSNKSAHGSHYSGKTKFPWFFDTRASHHMTRVAADFHI